MGTWIWTSAEAVLMVLVSAAAIYAAVVVCTRVVGLRSFSKMSSFDFAVTVAIGSLIASTILTSNPPLLQAITALVALYAIQWGVAYARERSEAVESMLDNEPLLLMAEGEMIKENLRETQVTESDVWAKLREANVLDLSEVRAVVLEGTGDISVLHGPSDGTPLAKPIMTGVRDTERLWEGPRDEE